MSSLDRETKHGQGQLFEDEDLTPAHSPSQSRYTCRSCGSPNLFGLGPSTDSKDRWRIAAGCNGCGKARVIAIRS